MGVASLLDKMSWGLLNDLTLYGHEWVVSAGDRDLAETT